jgi:hypothetical protein
LSAKFVIVGNPENRRVGLFQEALARQDLPPARVIRWLDLARVPRGEDVLADLPDGPAIVRIDSFGEDFDVTRELLRHGEDDARAAGVWTVPAAEIAELDYDRGRILAPRQEHLGFLRVLADLERALAARPHLRVYPSPRSIERLFDKRACARTFAAAGVPMAKPLPEVASADALRDAMRESGSHRVFVKLTCGSSASCLALYEWDPEEPEESWLFTSMEIAGDRLYNSLRPRRYRTAEAIERILSFLLREGSHVEEHVAKARLDGKFFDTRMVVVAGEVPFTLVRKSPHPVTNLHLGGVRGTTSELEALVPARVLSEAKASAARVFEAHDCLHLGVDVMFTAPTRTGGAAMTHVVLEANAFGDLLPNLMCDGLSVYEWEIRAAVARWKHDAQAQV